MSVKSSRAILLSISIILISLWSSSPVLNQYNLQLTGALILLYFASRLLFRHTVNSDLFFPTVMMVSICLLLIFSSGGLVSPIFFILNFLLFIIALLIAPYQAAVASTLLIIIFLLQNHLALSERGIIDLISLGLMTPLAVTFSKTYLKNLESSGKITLLQEAIKDEQVDSLLWIATSAKPSLSTVINSLSDIVVYFNAKGTALNVPQSLIEKLKTTQRDLISLYSSTGSLEQSIKESSDKMEL